MALFDRIDSILNRVGFRSEEQDQYEEEQPYYDPQPRDYQRDQQQGRQGDRGYRQQDDRGYVRQDSRSNARYDDQGYGRPPQDEGIDRGVRFESNEYNAGTGNFSSVGARVSSGKPKKEKRTFRDWMDDIRYGKPEPEEPEPADNVVPFEPQGRDTRYEEPPRGARQAGSSQRREREQDRYYDEPRQRDSYDRDPYAYDEEPAPRAARSGASTMIYLVRRLEEADKIIAHLMQGGNVIVNMEEIDDALKRRVLDILSGAAFALNYSVKRISYRNYYLTTDQESVITNMPERDRFDEGGRDEGRMSRDESRSSRYDGGRYR